MRVRLGCSRPVARGDASGSFCVLRNLRAPLRLAGAGVCDGCAGWAGSGSREADLPERVNTIVLDAKRDVVDMRLLLLLEFCAHRKIRERRICEEEIAESRRCALFDGAVRAAVNTCGIQWEDVDGEEKKRERDGRKSYKWC